MLLSSQGPLGAPCPAWHPRPPHSILRVPCPGSSPGTFFSENKSLPPYFWGLYLGSSQTQLLCFSQKPKSLPALGALLFARWCPGLLLPISPATAFLLFQPDRVSGEGGGCTLSACRPALRRLFLARSVHCTNDAVCWPLGLPPLLWTRNAILGGVSRPSGDGSQTFVSKLWDSPHVATSFLLCDITTAVHRHPARPDGYPAQGPETTHPLPHQAS